MKPLVLDSTMTNLGGVFYPTGHIFALFPDEDCVRHAASALQAAGHKGSIAYASPETIMEDIVHTLGTADGRSTSRQSGRSRDVRRCPVSCCTSLCFERQASGLPSLDAAYDVACIYASRAKRQYGRAANVFTAQAVQQNRL
jgi:hypothetical protein